MGLRHLCAFTLKVSIHRTTSQKREVGQLKIQMIVCDLQLYRIGYQLVMSDEDIVVVTKRKTNRLNLDSEEEARLEAEENQRIEDVRLRKEEKRRRREQEAKRVQQQARKKQQLQQHYDDPKTMFIEDSNSHDSFPRVQKKIRKAFPQFRQKEQYKRRHQSESEESEEQSDGDSESQQSSSDHKKKVQKKQKKDKRERRQQEQQARAVRHKVQRVKIEDQDPKQRLVKEVAIRWWYCLPEWPPANYPYEQQLRKQGYRLVQNTRFRMQQNIVGGLIKATPVDGYIGVFKTKLKILDIRPKEQCPSLKLLRSKSLEELTQLLKSALNEQILQLNQQKFQRSEDVDLKTQLERRLLQIN